MSKKFFESAIGVVISVAILLALTAFLLNYFKPELLLQSTITAGGDTASHYYPALYLKEYLIPHGKLTGWSQGWFAGLPMFEFYFLPSYLIAVLLSYLIPLQVAFKITTVLGSFLLPIAIFIALKLMRFSFPIPAVAAILSIPFLFLERNSMWGGNIPSTLAGEFSYSLSIALLIIFLGLAYKAVNEKKRAYALPAIVLALVALTHLATMLVALLSLAFFLLSKKIGTIKKNFFSLLAIAGVALLLASFWLVPAVSRIEYASSFAEDWRIEASAYPPEGVLLHFIALYAVYIGVARKDTRIRFICFSILATLFLMLFGSKLFNIINIRFWPIQYLLIFLLAGIALGDFAIEASNRLRQKAVVHVLPIVFLIGFLYFTSSTVTYIPSWIKWNYEGFESKAAWNEFSEINSFLTTISNQARIAYEHSPVHDKFGSLRAFESLPLFANKSTLEGLYMQSTISSPFVFYSQCEYSQVCSTPLPGYKYPGFDLANGTKHLKLFNAKYLIAVSEKLKVELRHNKEWSILKKVNEYEVWDLTTSAGTFVQALDKEPEFVGRENWKRISHDWYGNMNENTLVFSQEKPSQHSLRSDCQVRNENISNEEIYFETNCLNLPHLIKISYHPNWFSLGGEKIFLASPSFMLIYPKKERVVLRFGRTLPDYLGIFLTAAGIAIIIYGFKRSFKKK